MKLTYRGVTYNYNPQPLNLNNSHPTTTELKFRGNQYLTNQPTDQPGVNASTAPATAASPAPQPVATVSIEEKARELMMNHHKMVKRRQQAMLTRLAANVGLDAETTSRYWGHIQGKVQPGFWDSYDRSHASIS
ncbi:DUF4278 domain-containing protein [Thermoleptolyngbya sp.]